jgi:hypothetical protein
MPQSELEAVPLPAKDCSLSLVSPVRRRFRLAPGLTTGTDVDNQACSSVRLVLLFSCDAGRCTGQLPARESSGSPSLARLGTLW